MNPQQDTQPLPAEQPQNTPDTPETTQPPQPDLNTQEVISNPEVQPIAPQKPSVAAPPHQFTAPEPTAQPMTTLPPQPPTKKRTALWAALGAVFLIAVLGAAGTWAYITYFALTPAERFETALKNHLSTSYIQQDYVTTLGSSTASTDSLTDFSNPASPKIKAKFVMNIGEGRTFESEMIGTTSYCEYGKVNKYPIAGDANPYRESIGKWMNATTKEESFGAYDVFSGCAAINTTFGQILVGNYSASDRDALMEFIKTKQPYSFNDEEVVEETIEGRRLFKYPLTIDLEGIQELNDLAAEKLKLEKYELSDTTTRFTVWVDASTNRFVRVETKQGEATGSIDLSYPTTANIQIPVEAIPVPEL